ncbi:MAG: type I phosphomannose isomerase catalytic subunit [Bacillota bacterium]
MEYYKTLPVLKERIWGGSRLAEYNRPTMGLQIGESWEYCAEHSALPFLIKYLDANDILSIQVHPDDEHAWLLEKENNGKSEMWVILDCKEDSYIIYGFKKKVARKEVEEAIADNNIMDLLNIVKVKKGDCIYLPAGTIHTLGSGIIAYEIQQPSDLTYRLYDWDRTDKTGKKRKLHIEKALEVIDYSGRLPGIINIHDIHSRKSINHIEISNDSFRTKYHFIDGGMSYIIQKNHACIISLIEGSAYIISRNGKEEIRKGDTLVITGDSNNNMYIQGISNIEFIETSH